MAFAPQPIQIRYGPDGALAAGAAAAGAGQNYARQKAMDMQFLNAEADRRAAAEAQAQQLQANRLQMAHQLAMQRVGGTPTSATDRMKTPFVSAVQTAKQNAINAAIQSGELDANDPMVQIALGSPDIGGPQTLGMIGEKRTEKRKAGEAEGTRKAKKTFLATQPQSVKDQLGAYVDDDGVMLSQLRVAAQNITRSEAAEAKSVRSAEVTGIDTEMRVVQERMRQLAKQLEKSDVFPEQAPATLSPTFDTPEQRPLDTWGGLLDYWTSKSPRMTAEGKPVFYSGGDPEAMKNMRAYYELKRHIETLQARRQGLLHPQQSVAAAPQQQAAQPQQASTAAPVVGPGQALVEDEQTGQRAVIDKASGRVIREI